jgi:hypothetical protein
MEIKHRLHLNKLLPENPICAEVGCAEGLFSADILRWPAGKLYMVDAWETLDTTGDGASPQEWHDKNYSDAMKRVEPYKENVEVLRGVSWEMANKVEDESLDLVYLDAGHSYECVKRDLAAWFPKIKKGGVMAGHDYENNSYGVKRAVVDFCKGRFDVNSIPENKMEDAGFYFIK